VHRLATDEDGSGLISFYEFMKMTRKLLRVTVQEMSDASVQAMWRYVDEDASGHICAGEFLKLMRSGWQGYLDEISRLERIHALCRPNWRPTMNTGKGVWREQAMTPAEQRSYYLEISHAAALKRVDTIRATAQSYAAQTQLWSKQTMLPTLHKKHPHLRDDAYTANLAVSHSQRLLRTEASASAESLNAEMALAPSAE